MDLSTHTSLAPLAEAVAVVLGANGLDIVARDDFDYEEAGAELLGRDLAPLCRRNERLRTLALDLFKRETDGRGLLLMVSQMTQMARDEDLALNLLVAIQRGIEF